MATLQDFRNERLRKLEELKALGVNSYPAVASRSHNAADVGQQFEQLENQNVTVVGRIISIRKFGQIAFMVIRDNSGKVQLGL